MAVISLDAGHARDIMLMLGDACAVIGGLAAGAAPAAAARQAAALLRDEDSLYALPGLAAALNEVVTWLHHARRDALAGIILPPPGS